MSSITVRNVVGTGVFAMPTSESAANAATAALKSILNGITWLYYEDARVLVGAPQFSVSQELMFVIKTFFYDGSVVPNTNALRIAINSALIANPNISSVGTINIEYNDPGDPFWHQWPEIEWIDTVNSIVQYVNQIPAGAQIELAKYTKHNRGPHASHITVYTDHIGKRHRRMIRLPVGGVQINLTPYIRHASSSNSKRNVFRARFVWPAPPGTLAPAPGVVGPLAPYGVMTGSDWEQRHILPILMEAAPSFYKMSP